MEPNIRILYEDSDVLCCVKPAGILSQAAPGGEATLLTLLETQTGAAVYPVHRLDRQTGGVMVFAKTKAAAASLSAQAADRTLEKRYCALVHGKVEPADGELEDLLFKDARTNKVFVVSRERKGVRKAKLHYVVENFDGVVSRVGILLDTGRTHQIRVQFASRRHPVVGDRRYGSRVKADGIALWSARIAFDHPVDGRRMVFQKDPPADFPLR